MTRRLRLVVEIDVDVDELDDPADLPPQAKIDDCVQQAVSNALHETQRDGFEHDLAGDIAIFVSAVHLLKEG